MRIIRFAALAETPWKNGGGTTTEIAASPEGAGFAELRRSVGAITDSVLSDRLSELARAGLVERIVTDTRPPGVSYRLTESGSAIKPILSQLAGWASEHLPESCPPGEQVG